MKTLREQYQDLDRKINNTYTRLVNEVGGVNLYDVNKNEEEEDLSDCEIVTYVNRSGENIDAKVLQITDNSGIYVAKDEDDSKRFWIGLNDLSSLYDKITIVELLEQAKL